ncbi:MAG: DUF11 domain-containing protein [Thermoleophilia bacterium]
MRAALALIASAVAVAAAASPALGAVFTVTRFDDPAPDACAVGDCSLREALRDATANPGLDDVVLGEGTYLVTRSGPGSTAGSLDYGFLANPGDVRITGAGSALTIVRGQFEGATDRIFELAADDATITGLTVQGGESLGPGGGIWVQNGAALILVDAAVRDNTSTSGYGGGIQGDGTLTLTRATIAGNKAPGGNGGGVAAFGLRIMTDTTITGNSAGGTGGGLAFLYQGTISGGLVEGNTATTGGGLAFIAQAASVSSAQGTVTGTVVRGNTATGSGGGISVEALATSSAGGGVSFTRLTISGNTAGAGGGGLYARADNLTVSGAQASVLNSTISGNTAQQGGAVYVAADPTAVSGGQVLLKGVTVAANGATVGGGLFAANAATQIVLRNTLLGANGSASCVTSGTGAISSQGHNLSADASCNGVLSGAGDLKAVDPRLGPLASNRGPTQTHALLAGSPAVDAGDAAACVDTVSEKLLLDQRGVSRLGPCDIGAFEAEVDLALDLAPAAGTVTVGASVQVTATVTNVGGHGATGVVVTLTPVAGAPGPTSVAATPSVGACTGSAPVVCTIGPLAAGETATVTLALGTGAPGGLLVTGKVESAELDPDGTNDQDTASTTVTALPLPAGPVAADATVAPTLVYDAKKKRFLVRIQYRLREPRLVALCAAGCPATLQLRTRTGRVTFAATLKGDGKLVLGTRKGLKLAPGKRVRIDVPVPRAKLLKASFRTAGAYRVTQTRLRVILTTGSGKATTIRDGRIRVSIARIRSGALPGLAGILAQ